MILRALILAGLLVSLAVPAWEVAKKERILSRGDTLLLQLAPVDPRSLIQGDYMRLDYALSRSVPQAAGWPRDGTLVVRIGVDGVAEFARRDDGASLGEGERRLAYRIRKGRLQVGTDAYYFQEGTAGVYAGARFGEVRVAPDGTAVLVGLRDAERRPLGPR